MIRKNKGGRLENVIASVGIVITVCIAVFGYYIRTPYLYGRISYPAGSGSGDAGDFGIPPFRTENDDLRISCSE